MTALNEEVEILRGQVTDFELDFYIDGVLFEETKISISSSPILHSTLEEWKSGKKDTKSIKEALQKITETSFRFRERLQPISKRIEELLIGDEAKS